MTDPVPSGGAAEAPVERSQRLVLTVVVVATDPLIAGAPTQLRAFVAASTPSPQESEAAARLARGLLNDALRARVGSLPAGRPRISL